MAAVDIGVDFGGTGLRAAYVGLDGTAKVLALTSADWPWLLCEPAADGPLPVVFPSLKSKLGLAESVERDGRPVSPTDVVGEALGALRARITQETGAEVGQTVISIPARYSSVQRTALTTAASQAGLTDVALVSDSLAAVIGQADTDSSETYLVYAMGYEGIELGLVRAVRGRYRVLGYEGLARPGGRALDERLLAAWLSALRKNGVNIDLPDRTGWMWARRAAQAVKEGLSVADIVPFPQFRVGSDRGVLLTIERQAFAQAVRVLLARSLDRVDGLFGQTEMTKQNVDRVLLVGGSTRLDELRTLVSELGPATLTAPDHVARGAARYANQLASRSPMAYEGPLGVGRGDDEQSPATAGSPLPVTVLTVPQIDARDAPAAGPSARVDSVDRARELIAAGNIEDAKRELRRLIADSRALLAEISDSAPPKSNPPGSSALSPSPPGLTSAAHLIAHAKRLLDNGEVADAIATSHLAWERAPGQADVFDAMIDMHCTAAMANPTVERFPQDEKWLRCALSHDQGNVRVRALLAERLYTHAVQLSRLDRTAEALRAVGAALAWDPDHQQSLELRRRLGRARSR